MALGKITIEKSRSGDSKDKNSTKTKVNDLVQVMPNRKFACYSVDDNEEQLPTESLRNISLDYMVDYNGNIPPETFLMELEKRSNNLIDLSTTSYLIFLDINISLPKCYKVKKDVYKGIYLYHRLNKKFPKISICILTEYSINKLGSFYPNEIENKWNRWYLRKEHDNFDNKLRKILQKFTKLG
ncbi:MAG: hypothetical protein ABI402_11840 [Ferruginibacter sp.]